MVLDFNKFFIDITTVASYLFFENKYKILFFRNSHFLIAKIRTLNYYVNRQKANKSS